MDVAKHVQLKLGIVVQVEISMEAIFALRFVETLRILESINAMTEML